VNADFIRDLFAEFGAVEVRRMFGGAGIYADGVMFALVVGMWRLHTRDSQRKG
jgi:DNA transformation protein